MTRLWLAFPINRLQNCGTTLRQKENKIHRRKKLIST